MPRIDKKQKIEPARYYNLNIYLPELGKKKKFWVGVRKSVKDGEGKRFWLAKVFFFDLNNKPRKVCS